MVTIAYDAASGLQLWDAVFNNSNSSGVAVVVSPDSRHVLVTGNAFIAGQSVGVTIAYDTRTAAPIWTALFTGPPGYTGYRPQVIRLSPDGTRAYVGGVALLPPFRDANGNLVGENSDYGLVAYDASSGQELWTTVYNGPGNGADTLNDLQVSANGQRIFVTGQANISNGSPKDFNYGTLAVAADTGVILWTTLYNDIGLPNDAWFDEARALAISPDGSRVYVTGTGWGGQPGTFRDYVTLAYDSQTGAQVWLARYDGPAHFHDRAAAVGVSPDGLFVYVTGVDGQISDHYATIAYRSTDGTQVWSARQMRSATVVGAVSSLGVSPDGSRVYVTGFSWQDVMARPSDTRYETIAYSGVTGAKIWESHFDLALAGDSDLAYPLAISPDGARVFVSGLSRDPVSQFDFLTLALLEKQPPNVTLSPSPSSGEAPLAVSFSTSASDPDGTVSSWTFDADGDGTVDQSGDGLPPGTLTHTYATAGTFVALLQATDNEGAVGYAEATVTVTSSANQPPVLDPIGDRAVSEGQRLEFSVSASDPDGDALTFSASNLPPGASFDPATRTFSWTPGFDQAGSFPGVRFEVSDGQASDFEAITITVNDVNRPPTAALAADPSSGPAPLTVTLDASGSSDADGASDITGYSFDFGDGSATVTQAGATIGHTYNSAGSFTARVTVTDSAGNTDSAQTPVTVQSGPGANQPPVAKLVANPTSGIAPLAVSFDASGSSDPDNDISGYTFNFGDGSAPVTQATATANHTYRQVGSFSARVIVTDSQGATASMVVVISVQAAGQPPNSAPAASLAVSPASGQAPLTVAFDGSGSSDPNGDAIASYSFDFGDNSGAVTQTGPTISHTYDAAGTYRASLSVTDSQGQTSEPVFVTVTVTTSITVTPPGGPVAALKLTNNKGPAPLNVSFDGAKSFDRDGGTIQSYIFDFGDGSAVVTRTVSQFGVNAPLTNHVYLVPGTYTPSLSVTNDSGVVSPNPAKATVEATGPGGSKGGGAFGWMTLVPLLGVGVARRRRH